MDHCFEGRKGPSSAGIYERLDEIGKMECLSPGFVAAMRALLDAGRPVVATIGERGGGFIAEVKRRPDVALWRLTRDNRDAVPARILTWLRDHA